MFERLRTEAERQGDWGLAGALERALEFSSMQKTIERIFAVGRS